MIITVSPQRGRLRRPDPKASSELPVQRYHHAQIAQIAQI